MLFAAYSVGLLISLAPGTLTIATVQRTFCRGMIDALIFNVGVTASDILYLLIIYFGLQNIIEDNESLRLSLFMMSGVWLFWMGWSAVRQHCRLEPVLFEQVDGSYWQSFRIGFFMNLTNPLTIVGWTSIGGNFLSQWNVHWPPLMPFGLFAIAMMLAGVLSWQLLLILLGCFVRRLIKPVDWLWSRCMDGSHGRADQTDLVVCERSLKTLH
jgi:threonine/homoserine/homoserine lactone efflux protein